MQSNIAVIGIISYIVTYVIQMIIGIFSIPIAIVGYGITAYCASKFIESVRGSNPDLADRKKGKQSRINNMYFAKFLIWLSYIPSFFYPLSLVYGIGIAIITMMAHDEYGGDPYDM